MMQEPSYKDKKKFKCKALQLRCFYVVFKLILRFNLQIPTIKVTNKYLKHIKIRISKYFLKLLLRINLPNLG